MLAHHKIMLSALVLLRPEIVESLRFLTVGRLADLLESVNWVVNFKYN